MRNFRKKPVTIQAVKLTTNNLHEIVAKIGNFKTACAWDGGISIETLEGVMMANVGDYIIRGVRGEYYPCKGDIFEETYELAEPVE